MGSTIFAIDTAAERCTLALADGTRVESAQGEAGRAHLEHVLPMVAEFFARSGVQPADCDAFAFGSGPGSFTGLRIACTVVQGLALAVERPVIAVGNLDSVALAASGLSAQSPPPSRRTDFARPRILAVLDARMRQAYWSVCEAGEGAWAQLVPASLCDVGELPSLVEEWAPDICAGDRAWLEAHLGGWQGRTVDARADAAMVARIARDKLARGETIPAQDAAPTYTRDRVAQTVAERRDARKARGP